jgi:hypothetical protein
MTIPCKSSHACRGEPVLGNGMRFPGQVCAVSVPHHNQTKRMIHVITFGQFGGTFNVMNAQLLAILLLPISIF